MSSPPLRDEDDVGPAAVIDEGVRHRALQAAEGDVTYALVSLWSEQRVAQWMTAIGFGKYAQTFLGARCPRLLASSSHAYLACVLFPFFPFIDNDIRGDVLLDINLSVLKELEIVAVGERIRVLRYVAALRDECGRNARSNLAAKSDLPSSSSSSLDATRVDSPIPQPAATLPTPPPVAGPVAQLTAAAPQPPIAPSSVPPGILPDNAAPSRPRPLTISTAGTMHSDFHHAHYANSDAAAAGDEWAARGFTRAVPCDVE